MPSSVLFSSATFQEPAQATVLRSIECVKRKALEDDTLKLYEGSCTKNVDNIEKKETFDSKKSILGSVDNYVEREFISTISESQTLKIDVTSNVKSSVKKRKLKIIPNKINEVEILDSKNKTINFMTKVSIYCNYIN